MPSSLHEPSAKQPLSSKTIGANDTNGATLQVVFKREGYVDVSSSLDYGLLINYLVRRKGLLRWPIYEAFLEPLYDE